MNTASNRLNSHIASTKLAQKSRQSLNNQEDYSIDEFATMIGVSKRTLMRWDKQGIFSAYRRPSGRPFYTTAHYDEYRKAFSK